MLIPFDTRTDYEADFKKMFESLSSIEKEIFYGYIQNTQSIPMADIFKDVPNSQEFTEELRRAIALYILAYHKSELKDPDTIEHLLKLVRAKRKKRVPPQ